MVLACLPVAQLLVDPSLGFLGGSQERVSLPATGQPILPHVPRLPRRSAVASPGVCGRLGRTHYTPAARRRAPSPPDPNRAAAAHLALSRSAIVVRDW
jgi:hypothetical protein